MTEPKFKVGDIVRVVDIFSETPTNLIYTIIKIKTLTYNWYKAKTKTDKIVWWCEDQLILERSS